MTEERIWEEACAALQERMKHYTAEDVMVAFSGGADSSLLLKLACEAAETNGTNVCAVTMQTRLHPAPELTHAIKVAREIGAEHRVISVDELLNAGIWDNPKDRCYLCKKHLFLQMRSLAGKLGIGTILEGTNADDLKEYRPGLKALSELRIKSPLMEAGFTKEEVRRLACSYGLSVSSRPAMPCLATRFPYGTPLSYEALTKVEQGEAFLKKIGGYDIRLRVHGETARIEVDDAAMELFLAHRSEITAYLKKLGYRYITLDLEGFRSGSMDIGLT